MLRKIVDYKKLDHRLASLLIETYPNGYGDEDIIAFKNAQGEIIEAVELRTDDIVYLVKISKSLAHFISNFEDQVEKELQDDEDNDGEKELEGVDSLSGNDVPEMEDDNDSDYE